MKKSPTAATNAFREYIKLQPNSPLSANAQYWIGEIMYSHNNYKGAVQEFIKVLQKYKYSDKAPDAAIKLGYSFYALKIGLLLDAPSKMFYVIFLKIKMQ